MELLILNLELVRGRLASTPRIKPTLSAALGPSGIAVGEAGAHVADDGVA